MELAAWISMVFLFFPALPCEGDSCLEELRATLEEGGRGVGRAVPILRAV